VPLRVLVIALSLLQPLAASLCLVTADSPPQRAVRATSGVAFPRGLAPLLRAPCPCGCHERATVGGSRAEPVLIAAAPAPLAAARVSGPPDPPRGPRAVRSSVPEPVPRPALS